MKLEIHRAGSRLESSSRSLEVAPDSLKGVVEIGLGLAGADALEPVGETSDERPMYSLPPLDRSWDLTLDTLRPPRGRHEAFWEWRQKPPRPVTFHPLTTLSEEAEQLHLSHPFVRRILDRFLAQGFSAHDLSRVTAIVAPDDTVVRVVAYARLSLFGPGAARLHDEIVSLAAAWSGKASKISPYKDPVTAAKAKATVERLLAQRTKPLPGKIREQILPELLAPNHQLAPLIEDDAVAIEDQFVLAPHHFGQDNGTKTSSALWIQNSMDCLSWQTFS